MQGNGHEGTRQLIDLGCKDDNSYDDCFHGERKELRWKSS